MWVGHFCNHLSVLVSGMHHARLFSSGSI